MIPFRSALHQQPPSRDMNYIGDINNQRDCNLLTGDLLKLLAWLSACAPLPEEFDDVSLDEESDPLLPPQEQTELRRPSITLLQPHPSLVTAIDLDNRKVMFNALRTGDDYFENFVRYLVDPLDINERKKTLKKQRLLQAPKLCYHRLVHALCCALKSLVQDIQLGLCTGITLY